MKKQFGIVYNQGRWHVVSLHGDGDVLASGVKISDHPSRARALAKAEEYKRSHEQCFPEDTVTISSE